MGHLIADVIFVALALVIVLVCAKRGFLKNLIRTFRLVIAAVLTYFLGGRISELLYNNVFGNMIRNFMRPGVQRLYDQAEGILDPTQAISKLPAFLRTEEVETKLNTFVGKWTQGVKGLNNQSVLRQLFDQSAAYYK